MTNKNSSIANNKDNLFNFDNYILSLIKSKYWIIGLTIALTFIIVIFGLLKTPSYQASAKIILGSYDVPQIICNNELRIENACKKEYQKEKLIRHSTNTVRIINLFALENISNLIEIKNNQNDTLSIISNASSTEEAKINLEKIIDFLTQENSIEIKNIKESRQESIRSFRDKINSITIFELQPLRDKGEINASIFKRKVNETEENILILEKQNLPQINNSIYNLNKIIEEKLDFIKNSNQTISNKFSSEISITDEKITLYENYNNENNILLKVYQENLKQIDSNEIDQIISQSSQISNLKKEIFKINEQIIQLKAAKEKLVYQLDFVEEEKKLTDIRDNGFGNDPELIVNFNSIGATELIRSVEFKILEYKNLLDNFKNQKTMVLEKIAEEKLSLLELKDEQNLFLNFTMPTTKAKEKLAILEIDNLNYQLSEYEELILPEAYSNIKLIGNINSPQKQFSPNILLYGIYGFISSLSLFIFLFSIINLFRSPNKD